jgi:fido (protein-threonine AMPylation protein)
MNVPIAEVQELLHQKADVSARLKLLPYDGSPEVKEQRGNKYLYIRKREGGRLTSTYVDAYSDALYQMLLRNAKEARALRKQLRAIEKKLLEIGYVDSDISPLVAQNLTFARANMKVNIYNQAVLEGVATTFPQTEEILENGKVTGMTATDVQKVLNLKHAWEFILDPDVIQSESNYYVLCHIAKLVNEGFFADGGRIRGVPVAIGGTSYIPPLPMELDVKDRLKAIVSCEQPAIDTAIDLCLYCMKTQIFNDGNKRAAVIFANHYLIAQGGGMLVIPEENVPAFKKLLVAYYEDKDHGRLRQFMKENGWRRF